MLQVFVFYWIVKICIPKSRCPYVLPLVKYAKRVEVGASLSGASELDMKVDSIMYSWLALYL